MVPNRGLPFSESDLYKLVRDTLARAAISAIPLARAAVFNARIKSDATPE